MGFQLVGKAHGMYLFAQRLLHRRKEISSRLIFLGQRLLLLIGGKIDLIGADIKELLAVILPQRLDGKFIHLPGHIQHLVAGFFYLVGLRQSVYCLYRAAAAVVDGLLALFHTAHIFLQGRQLLFGGGIEQLQILQGVLVHAVVHAQAVGQLRAKFLPQRLIFLTVVFQ